MNYSTAVFLINQHLRCVQVSYDPDNKNEKPTPFKTLDPTIKAGDFVVVPTTTRYKMTVCKVGETDVDVDFDSSTPMDWIIGKVDRVEHDKTLDQERTAISAIKSAEMRTKREALRDSMLKAHVETLKALPIADMNGNGGTPEIPPAAPQS